MSEANENNEVPILSRLSPPAGAVRPKKRRGRGLGSNLGKTAGKGQKGQKARHPGKFGKMGFEGGQLPFWQRLPKRGFTNNFAKVVGTFNVSDLDRFEAGSTIDIAALKTAGLIRKNVDVVKCLGNGELKNKVTVQVNRFSKSAITKIEAAGGTAEVVKLKVPAPIVRNKKAK